MNKSKSIVRYIYVILTMLMTQNSYSIEYVDHPTLKPSQISITSVKELTKTINTQNNLYKMKGLEVKVETSKTNRLKLIVTSSPKLNLWRGRPNDLLSKHLGEMEIIINSVHNPKNENVYNPNEPAWAKKVVTYHLGENIFQGYRSVKLLGDNVGSEMTKIKGKILLRVPIGFDQYTIINEPNPNIKEILKHKDISAIKVKEKGISIEHPTSKPEFPIIIMGYDSNDQRLSISSSGSSGRDKKSRWYYFPNKTIYTKMLIFIPKSFFEITLPFEVSVSN